MRITQKIGGALLPISLIIASPAVFAQVAPAEVVQTVPAETLKLAEQTYTEGKIAPSWRDKKVAVRGRDIVSFTQDSGPVKGKKKYAADFDDTKWYFKTKENRDTFLKDPNKYVPEFGGYCPVALSTGEVKIGKTNQFTRHEGRTYMNYNRKNRETFSVDPESYILKARATF